jgi:hypothetical protein
MKFITVAPSRDSSSKADVVANEYEEDVFRIALPRSNETTFRSKDRMSAKSQRSHVRRNVSFEAEQRSQPEDDRYEEEDYGSEDERRQEIIRQNGKEDAWHQGCMLPSRHHTHSDWQDGSHAELELLYSRHKEAPGAATFPPGIDRPNSPNGRRAYPKEKWVSPAPALLHVETEEETSGDVQSVDSMDDFLKTYEKFGKYAVDTTSLIASRMSGPDLQERYDYMYSNPRRSYCSDDDIAKWRSEDEDDSSEEDDWDVSFARPRSKVAIMASPNDDEVTLESFEMMHYDPRKVQTLTSEHRLQQKNGLLGHTTVKKATKKLAKKMTKNGRKAKPDPRARGNETRHWNSSARKPQFRHKGARREKQRTLSSMSDSGASDDDGASCKKRRSKDRDRLGDSDSNSSSSLSILEQKSFRKDHRKEHSRWLAETRKNGKGVPYPRVNSNTTDEDELSQASSGSLSERAQKRFRTQMREKHFKWLAQKKKQEKKKEKESDEEDTSDKGDNHAQTRISFRAMPRSKSSYTKPESRKTIRSNKTNRNSNRSRIWGLFRRQPTKRDRLIEELMAKFDERDKSKGEGENEDEDEVEAAADNARRSVNKLPWEEPKMIEPKGFAQQVLATIRPPKQPVRTVEDLPFPKSDSFDKTFVSTDKYVEIIKELPALVPGGDDYGEAIAGAPVCSSTECSAGLSNAGKKAPLQGAIRGLGNSLMSFFNII